MFSFGRISSSAGNASPGLFNNNNPTNREGGTGSASNGATSSPRSSYDILSLQDPGRNGTRDGSDSPPSLRRTATIRNAEAHTPSTSGTRRATTVASSAASNPGVQTFLEQHEAAGEAVLAYARSRFGTASPATDRRNLLADPFMARANAAGEAVLAASRARSATTPNTTVDNTAQLPSESGESGADTMEDATLSVSRNTNEKCVVCHEPMGMHETPVTLTCGHVLGSVCMATWLHVPGRTHGCPLCRATLFDNPEAEVTNADGIRRPNIFAEMDRALDPARQQLPPTPPMLINDPVLRAARADASEAHALFSATWNQAKAMQYIADGIEHHTLTFTHILSNGARTALSAQERTNMLDVYNWRTWQHESEEQAKARYMQMRRAEEMVMTITANRGYLQYLDMMDESLADPDGNQRP